MKILVQQTLRIPQNYRQIDSSQWKDFPTKPLPVGGETIDEVEGWIFDLLIQGISFSGNDHYCVEDLANGGVRVTVWNDDPDDIPEEEFTARVWTLLPLAPDARLGGAINTQQSQIVFASPSKLERLREHGPVEHTTYRLWSEFHEPPAALVRHGIWLPPEALVEHQKEETPHGWREWGDHLDLSELDEQGFVRTQRSQGRYDKPRGTITYFLHDVTVSSGIHAAGFELEMEETDVAVPTNVNPTVPQASDTLAFMWSTLSGSPGVDDWPNGAYRCQIDVNQVMLVDGYGFLTRGGSAGHFARVDSGLTADQQSWTQDESAFTGTGIKLATHTIDPSSGASGDRFEALLAADNSDTMMDGNLRISHDDSDSFADGPWTAAAASDKEFAATEAGPEATIPTKPPIEMMEYGDVG